MTATAPPLSRACFSADLDCLVLHEPVIIYTAAAGVVVERKPCVRSDVISIIIIIIYIYSRFCR